MNGAQLEAAFAAHKVPILATAGAGVAALALLRRKKAGSSSAAATDTPSLSTGGQLAGTAGAGGYDSTSTDLYAALSPQLGSLAAQLSDLQNKVNNSSNTPVPVPVPTPPPVVPVNHVADTGHLVPGANNVKDFRAPVKPAPVHKLDQWITVNRGQTLSGIAAKYGPSVTPTTIARTNGIANPNRIYAGQKLHILG